MRRKATITALFVALAMLTTSVAIASSGNGVEKQDIVQIFEEGEPTGPTPVGAAKLIRRDDGLKATAQISGLEPGGVYTFWWVVIPEDGSFPGDAFVAGSGGKVIGSNGKATMRMNADYGQPGIEGFLIPFQPLTFDLESAEVHVEIAYHGQATDAGGDLEVWLSDFWTGSACPAEGTQAETQPHCPVSYVAIFPGS